MNDPKIIYHEADPDTRTWIATFDHLHHLYVEHTIIPWCRDNLDYSIAFFGGQSIFLRSQSDYVMFVIKWK